MEGSPVQQFEYATGLLDEIRGGEIRHRRLLSSIDELQASPQRSAYTVTGVYQPRMIYGGELEELDRAGRVYHNLAILREFNALDTIHPTLIAVVYDSANIAPDLLERSFGDVTGRILFCTPEEVPDFLNDKPLGEFALLGDLQERLSRAQLQRNSRVAGRLKRLLAHKTGPVWEAMSSFGLTRQELGTFLTYRPSCSR